jgi:hypothetical protein
MVIIYIRSKLLSEIWTERREAFRVSSDTDMWMKQEPIFVSTFTAEVVVHLVTYSWMIVQDGSRDSSIGIATGYGLDGRGIWVRVPVGTRFPLFTSSRPVLGPIHPRIQWVQRVLSQRVKFPGREADHSSPASNEVKNTWIYILTPPYVFMV